MAAHEFLEAAREIADSWARTLRGIRDPQLQIGQVRAHLARLGPARAADVLTIVLARAEQREEPFAVLLLRVSLTLAAPDLGALKRAIAHVAEARGQLALASFLGAEPVDAGELDIADNATDGPHKSASSSRAGPRASTGALATDHTRTSAGDAARGGDALRHAARDASSAGARDPTGAAEPTRSDAALSPTLDAHTARLVDPALARMLANRGRPLSLGERKSLARRRDKNVLARVLRDPHPDVVRILLDNPALTELDVVRLCARRPVHPETLVEVFRHPRWICRYRVRLTLALNPHTPEELSLQLLPHLLPADRKAVARSGDLPERVRAACAAPRHRRLH